MTFVLGACHNSILGVYGIFLTKNMFQSSKFSEGIFLHGLFFCIKSGLVGRTTDLNLDRGLFNSRILFEFPISCIAPWTPITNRAAQSLASSHRIVRRPPAVDYIAAAVIAAITYSPRLLLSRRPMLIARSRHVVRPLRVLSPRSPLLARPLSLHPLPPALVALSDHAELTPPGEQSHRHLALR